MTRRLRNTGRALVLAIAATPAMAEPLSVRVEWPRGPIGAVAVTVRAVSEQRDQSGTPTIMEIETERDEGELFLNTGLWTLTAHAPGYWSHPLIVPVRSGDKATARIALWPAASAEGRWSAPEDTPAPGDIEMRFLPTGDDAASLPGGVVSCPVDGSAFRCSVPAGRFDLEIRPKGFIPRYAWGVAFGPRTDLGLLVLRRGASVAGRIGRRDGSLPEGPCEAEIVVAAPRSRLSGRPAGADRTGRFTATVNAQGFFQLADVPPGEHPLSIECPEARGRLAVNVEADAETRLPGPFAVLGEGALHVVFDPPVDPAGGAWRMTLLDAAARRPPPPTAASPEGRWSFRGLPAGRYDFEVHSAAGARWRRGSIDWSESDEPVSIHLPSVPVIGRVRLDERPLRATVTFTDAVGSTSLSFTTDSGGLFDGPLPQTPAGGWIVDVDARDPTVHRRVDNVTVQQPNPEEKAWVDLSFAGLALRGQVVSEGGTPQPGVLIASETPAGVRAQVTADDGGAFELPVLAAGRYRLRAVSAAGASEDTEVELLEGGPNPPLRIVLGSARRIVGQVLYGRSPVPQATVRTRVPPGPEGGSLLADATGRFEDAVPAGASSVALTVAAPGHPLRMARIVLQGDEPIVVPLAGAAGQLVLDVPADLVGAGATVVLSHDSAIETLDALIDWGALNGGGLSGTRVVVPQIEPGSYEACLVATGEVARAWSGMLPKEQCRSGQLEAGGQLTLNLSTATLARP